MWSRSDANSVKMWIHRFSNHTHPYMTGVAPLQSVKILSNSCDPSATYFYDPQDDFNNTMEYVAGTLNSDSELVYNISYEITLKETLWKLRERNEGVYDTTDPLYQNLTGAENNLQVENPSLISLSNSLCEGKNSIIDKVDAILDWITKNIEYDEDATVSRGAYLTYLLKLGDCSDFSTLFTTLLRIQGIPARKVVGLVIMDDGYLATKKEAGYQISYYYGTTSSGETIGTIPGHAWVEYYIPGYGFISMDPTWSQTNPKYRNYMDYIHLPVCIGENLGGGVQPSIEGSVVEWGFIPYIKTSNPNDIRWSLSIDITYLEVDYKTPQSIPFHTGTFIVACSIIIALLSTGMIHKRSKKKD
ncbi:MAG: transglutaminase domain-containing protein [Candidatus Lokiarchaeota archaeon]|nr:transglutaminase domain-containing protein [Candidatus Lokiarchaeota archaeon]